MKETTKEEEVTIGDNSTDKTNPMDKQMAGKHTTTKTRKQVTSEETTEETTTDTEEEAEATVSDLEETGEVSTPTGEETPTTEDTNQEEVETQAWPMVAEGTAQMDTVKEETKHSTPKKGERIAEEDGATEGSVGDFLVTGGIRSLAHRNLQPEMETLETI